MKKIIRFIWFVIVDVMWEGIRFLLEAPFWIWQEFNIQEELRKPK